MDVVGTVMSVAQTLFAASQSSELKEFLSVLGYKSHLEDLEHTVSTIQAVFQDVERKLTLSSVEKKLIEDLKDAVYKADDLLDKFVTLAEQKKLLDNDGSLSEKLLHFFTPSKNQLVVAYRMSKGVKKIKKKLEAIAYNKQFCFVHDPEPIRNRRPDTCSYVNEVEIIGRGMDLEKIVDILLNLDVQQDLSFLSIFGIGGMGKTALAQLLFNDPRVTSAFPLNLWTCVSDQHQKKLDVKEILGNILTSATRRNVGSTLDEVQSQLREQLAGKKYLLVLDDVWTEEREKWSDLVKYFVGGLRGSWIMVTTRSQWTATIIGGKASPRHELQGLSKEDSWSLFERIAFGPDESNPPDDLVELGQEIIGRCVGVPLAIRVVGSLLYCQEKSMWQSVKDIGSTNFLKSKDGIMSVLQLSYDHLESSLKSCFRYCALFPKDFLINKEMLIDLWMAQGYVPFSDHQCVGEEYVSILLKRCFFQDIKRDELGDILSFKMHDLIHDLAQSVSQDEIYAARINELSNEKVRHFSFLLWGREDIYLHKTHVRSYIHVSHPFDEHIRVDTSYMKLLISSCKGIEIGWIVDRRIAKFLKYIVAFKVFRSLI